MNVSNNNKHQMKTSWKYINNRKSSNPNVNRIYLAFRCVRVYVPVSMSVWLAGCLLAHIYFHSVYLLLAHILCIYTCMCRFNAREATLIELSCTLSGKFVNMKTTTTTTTTATSNSKAIRIMETMEQARSADYIKLLKARGVNTHTCTHTHTQPCISHAWMWVLYLCASTHWACAKHTTSSKETREAKKKNVDGRQIMSAKCICITKVLTDE